MLEYKQKRNNGRTPFAGVYKFACVRALCSVHVWDQTGSKLAACDWPSFKMNHPQINNSCM